MGADPRVGPLKEVVMLVITASAGLAVFYLFVLAFIGYAIERKGELINARVSEPDLVASVRPLRTPASCP